MTRSLHILNSSGVDASAMRRLARDASGVFGCNVSAEEFRLDIERAFDASRMQYNSGILLGELLRTAAAGGETTIAVVDVDLFVPVLTFVFGQAQFRGPAAIVSTQRLGNQFYGLPQDDDLLCQRLAKEIVHELGHTFGLYHCRQFECVMRASTYVEEIDLKQIGLCAACRTLLGEIRR